MFRKRLRLRDFDYRSNGAYFVTACTEGRSALLIDHVKVVVEEELSALPVRFPGLSLDQYVVMPDHVHAIISISNRGADLPHIMQAFKSLSTIRFREDGLRGRIWQRGYFDRIIRNDGELDALREYIQNNPIAQEIKGLDLP
jgi:putative transposase